MPARFRVMGMDGGSCLGLVARVDPIELSTAFAVAMALVRAVERTLDRFLEKSKEKTQREGQRDPTANGYIREVEWRVEVGNLIREQHQMMKNQSRAFDEATEILREVRDLLRKADHAR